MADDVSEDQIKKEKRLINQQVSDKKRNLIDKILAKARSLISDEPFPDDKSLLDEQHKVVEMEKKLGNLLEPRTIKKPTHHLKQAEKVKL